MTRGVSWFFVAPLVLLGLSGCKFGLEQREPWRTEAEERCLAGGLVKPSAYIVQDRAINGSGTCGMDRPFRITAFSEGTIEVSPRATLACPMTAAVDRWMSEGVQPAAMAWFGQPVVKVKQMSSYSCRRMNGAKTGKISEHAFGNGFDIGGFVLADGREISVQKGWKGSRAEQGFLRTIQADACERFSVVLAPGSNVYHYDHIHVDLMRRAPGRTTCKPAAQRPTPPNLPVFKAQVPATPPQGAPGWPQPAGVSAPEAPWGAPGQEMDGIYEEEGISSAPRQQTIPVPEPVPSAAYPGAQQAGRPIDLAPAPAYPSAYPADPYAQGGHPAQTHPPQAYPPQSYPAPAPYPAGSAYPAQAAPAAPVQPARRPPPGVPLPPAGIPLAKWLGLDPGPTGASGNARSFTAEK